MVLEWDLDPDVEVPISAIEHYSYCPRQCALIHVEQTFDENLFTIRGQLVHERVDRGDDSVEDARRVMRDIPLWSEQLRLRGKADVVVFNGDIPYPIEYKLGRPHGVHADLQLCAQALCLEEMLGVEVPKGAIFHYALRRRREIDFTPALRERTIAAVTAIRVLLAEQRVPAAPNDERCPKCSLIHACMPAVVAERDRLRGLEGSLFVPLAAGIDP